LCSVASPALFPAGPAGVPAPGPAGASNTSELTSKASSLSAGDEVVVPGSTANLGGGFDTLGLALQLYLRVRIREVREDGGSRLEVVTSTPPVRGRNAVERAFAAMVQRTGRRTPTLIADVESDVPMSAGLGSSAAATVAGIRTFEGVAGPVDDGTMLGVATALEGHADNAAPALHGGLTSVVEPDGGDPVVLKWSWPGELRVVTATPFTGLATAKARAALAPSIARKDAVFNLQHVLALVHALQARDFRRLREAVADRWHQPARAALVPHLPAVLALRDDDVLGAFLSGAGPTVAVLARDNFPRVERLLATTCERAGVPVTVRTLSVHQSHDVPDVAVSAHGRTV
jgi:homoserine kinase